MNKLVFLPIEPMEERYSWQMLAWVRKALEESKVEYRIVEPKFDRVQIQHGQWLDTYRSNAYKAAQMQIVADMFQNREIPYGTLFLVGDTWYPGIEAIKLMAELSKIKVWLAGWHYAGMFDPHDFLTKNLKGWAIEYEKFLLRDVYDSICVGSLFHKSLIAQSVREAEEKICPYGLAWDSDELLPGFPHFENVMRQARKENIVFFPHRLADEKQPHLFYELAKRLKPQFPDWRFVITTGHANSQLDNYAEACGVEIVKQGNKVSYLDFISRAKIYYSAGLQETFGYALHEAVSMGCSVVAPYRCSYPEMLRYDDRFLYKHEDDEDGEKLLRQRILNFIPVPKEYTDRFSGNVLRWLNNMKDWM